MPLPDCLPACSVCVCWFVVRRSSCQQKRERERNGLIVFLFLLSVFLFLLSFHRRLFISLCCCYHLCAPTLYPLLFHHPVIALILMQKKKLTIFLPTQILILCWWEHRRVHSRLNSNRTRTKRKMRSEIRFEIILLKRSNCTFVAWTRGLGGAAQLLLHIGWLLLIGSLTLSPSLAAPQCLSSKSARPFQFGSISLIGPLLLPSFLPPFAFSFTLWWCCVAFLSLSPFHSPLLFYNWEIFAPSSSSSSSFPSRFLSIHQY